MTTNPERLEILLQDLRDLDCPVMADTLFTLYRSPEFLELDPVSLLQKIVSPQYEETMSRRINARLRRARLDGSTATLELCQNSNDRTYLPNGVVPILSQLNFVQDGQNVCIVGPSGSGKTYLAKALTIKTCNSRRALYCHCDELLSQLADLKEESNKKYHKQLTSLTNLDLLTIDDFLLQPVGGRIQMSVLFDLLEQRCEKRHSTIVCAQRSPESWNAMMGGDVALGDAVLRRATLHYSVVIEIPTAN